MGKKRSEIFDEVAQLYDAVRPGYPKALIEDVIELADLQTTATILEVGTGTGQATIPFASRGYTIWNPEETWRQLPLKICPHIPKLS